MADKSIPDLRSKAVAAPVKNDFALKRRAPQTVQAGLAHRSMPSSSIDLRAADGSPDCIKIIGLDGLIKHINKTGRQALRIESAAPSRASWISALPERVHDKGLKALEVARDGRSARFVGVSDVGELRYWDNMLTPLSGSDGSVENILCISRDVTDELVAAQGAQLRSETLVGRPRPSESGAPGSPDLQRREADHADEAISLSAREKECLMWVAHGKTAWETAIIAGISNRTVEFHLNNAVRKLNAVNKVHAAFIALNRRLM